MATDAQEKAAASGGQTRMVVIDTQQHAARELAAEMEQLRKDGKQLDKTVPGGRFLSADGKTFHDAFGNVIAEDGDKPKKGAVDLTSPEDIGARLRELEEERTKLLAQQQVATAQAQSDAATAGTGQGSGDADDDDETPAKRSAKKSSARR